MDLVLRTIDEGEQAAFARSAVIPFLELGKSDAPHYWARFLELDRTWVVVDGDRFVANCCLFSRTLTVPGVPGKSCPTVPTAAVSGVGVHPTHRRRGLLGRMMTAMLDDARARHEPVASLLASESLIYGRFGFGLSTATTHVTIPTRRSAFLGPVPALSLTLMDPEEAGKVVPGLFARLSAARAGQVDRDDPTWASILADPPDHRDGATARYWAVGDEGFVSWRVKDGDVPTMHLLDLYGSTPEVEAALWRFVLDIDLIEVVSARNRPVDEVLRWRLADPRQLRTVALGDFLWTRVLDVPRALEARGYPVADRLVLDVTAPAASTADPDPAVGRFVLEAGPDGSTCRPAAAGEVVDLRLGLADLGSLLFGGIRATALAAAGRVSEERLGALTAADRLFLTAAAPFTGTGF